MESQITIKYPNNLPDVLHLSRSQFEEEAKMAMAVKLFELKKLSSGMAADLAGISRVEFLMKLHQYGVNMIDYDPNELHSDIENA